MSTRTRHDRTRPRPRLPAADLAAALLACASGLLSRRLSVGRRARAASPAAIVATKQPTSLAELQQAADKAQKQVAALDDRLEVVVEDWDRAQSQLTAIQGQLGQIRLQLTQSQSDLARQQAILGSHLAWMYKLGDYGLLDELLNGGSLTDAAARIELLKRLNQQDRQLRDGFLADGAAQSTRCRPRSPPSATRRWSCSSRSTPSARRSKTSWPSGRPSSTGSTAASRRSSTQRARRGRARRRPPGPRRARPDRHHPRHGGPGRRGPRRPAVPRRARTSGAGPRPSGFDCSGLVLYVYARYGVTFPHFAAFQAEMGTPVPESQLEPADLVFFGSPIHHVVIYAGNGLVVEAPHTGDVVKVSRLSDFEAPTACRRYLLRLP